MTGCHAGRRVSLNSDPRHGRRLSRRALLRAGVRGGAAGALSVVVLPLAACGSGREGSGLSVLGVATATPTATPTPPVPTASPGSPSATAPSGPAAEPVISLDPPEVGQGEAAILTVRQPGAASGGVRLLGQRIPLTVGGEGLLWCVVAAGLLQPLGETSAEVTTRDALGDVLSEVTVALSVVAVTRPVDYLTTTPEVAAVLTPEAAEIEAALRAYEQFNLFSARPLWDGPFIVPVENAIQTTTFGEGRSINGGPVTGQHSGTDLASKEGTPILAAADGRVAWVGEMPIRGNSVLVDHGAGVVTGYHHLLEWGVEVGDRVAQGDEIAKMGSTGFSTGPHLHWEMTIYGVNVDPMTWVTRPFLPLASAR